MQNTLISSLNQLISYAAIGPAQPQLVSFVFI